MAILSHRLQVLTDQEKDAIDELRKLRNVLIHANAGRLGNMEKKSCVSLYEELETEFYLAPLSDEGGIRADALKYLCFTSVDNASRSLWQNSSLNLSVR